MRSFIHLAVCHLLWTFLSGCGSQPVEDPQTAAWEKHYQAGLIAMQKGDHREAETQLQQALSIARQFPEGSLALQSTLNDLGDLSLIRGRPTRAESLYLDLLEIQKIHRGPENAGTASTLEKLADLYRTEHRSARAESLYLHLLNVRHPRDRDQGYPSVLGKLAGLYRERGEFTRADTLAKRSLALKAHAQGYQYFTLGQYRQAETFYRRALDVQKRNLPNNHPDLAITCFDLARLYETQGALAQAEAFYRSALSIEEGNLGSEHRNLVAILDPLAALLERLERSAEAAVVKTRADSLRALSAAR